MAGKTTDHPQIQGCASHMSCEHVLDSPSPQKKHGHPQNETCLIGFTFNRCIPKVSQSFNSKINQKSVINQSKISHQHLQACFVWGNPMRTTSHGRSPRPGDRRFGSQLQDEMTGAHLHLFGAALPGLWAPEEPESIKVDSKPSGND